MKVFISWSGARSKQVAEALRDWLPNVIQNIDPFLSSHDIAAGARWGPQLAAILEQARFGVLCLTPENLTAPWILFEAGALSKTLTETYVCPYLFDLQPSGLTEPLSQFQAMRADRDETLKLVQTINQAALEQGLPIDRLGRAFAAWWPELERKLQAIVPSPNARAGTRGSGEILEEILEHVRRQSRLPINMSGEFFTNDQRRWQTEHIQRKIGALLKYKGYSYDELGVGVLLATISEKKYLFYIMWNMAPGTIRVIGRITYAVQQKKACEANELILVALDYDKVQINHSVEQYGIETGDFSISVVSDSDLNDYIRRL